jgi:hypothetical protein
MGVVEDIARLCRLCGKAADGFTQMPVQFAAIDCEALLA